MVIKTWYFKNHENWSGLLMDIDHENIDINLHRHKITKENINVPDNIKIQLSDINKSSYLGGETIYNNSTVGRNKDCWGACKYWDKKTNSIPEYSTIKPDKYNLKSKNTEIVFISLMIILSTILLLYFTLRRR